MQDDIIVHYLTDGYWQQQGGERRTFNVSPGGTLTANITALTSEGQQLAQWALEAWTEVTGINFSLATTTDANITFDDSEDGAGTLYTSLSDEGYILSAHVNVSEQWIHIHGEGMDSYAFTTYIHEIGHALGLGHPGPYNGDYPDFITDTVSFHDSWQTSVMSYIPQNQNIFTPANYATPVTPMIADIMAIHELYGAPASVNGGNTIYGYNANTGSYMDEYFRLWTGEGNPFAKTVDIHQPTFIGDYMVALSLDKRTIHFYENTGTATNPNFVHYDSVNWGDPIQDYQILDADRDGDLDAIIADNTGVYYVETNPESQIEILLSGTYTGKFEFVDIDGDSDYDVVEIFGNQVYTRENIGTPTELLLTDRIYEYTLHYNVSEFKFADLDGDNDYDFVAVDYYGGTYYYENEGSPTSPIYDPDGFQYPGNPLDSVFYGNRPKEIITDFAFADLDDDGDLDVFSIDNYSTVHYFKNVGTATNFNFIPTNFNRQTTLTLYDTDGTDLLDLRTDNHDQWIDLNPGAVSHVYGLEGNLVIAHDTIIEKLIAGRGNDIIFGNTANNAIIGFYGDDFLFGNDGNDTLKGHHGDDLLRGDRGNDRLIGGSGADTLVGGLGNDKFVFSPADGVYDDRIVDFRNGDNTIDLSAFDTIDSVDDFGYLYYDETEVDTYLDLTGHGGGKIILAEFTDSITASDFIFSDTVVA